MIKKLLTLSAIFLTFAIPTQALTIQELQSSPQFERVFVKEYGRHDDAYRPWRVLYVNTYSVEVLEYAAPQDESGIKVDIQGVRFYDTDGNPVGRDASVWKTKESLGRNRYDEDKFAVADALFYAAYHQHFDDIVTR